MNAELSESQLHILHHTLGLTPERRDSYRNHFLAGPGHHDMPDLEALEAAGFVERRGAPKFCRENDIMFFVTDAGQTVAIDNLPEPPKLTSYQEYLRSECCESFAEWLGIVEPEVQQGRLGWKYERRRYDAVGRIEIVSGAWMPTKKEAKASYKEALQQHHVAA